MSESTSLAVQSASLPVAKEPTLYGLDFWLAYSANVALVSANAITFRFAEYIAFLKGSEAVAGQIFGTGMLAALLARFWLGQGLDRFGPRRIWILGSLLFLCGCLLLPLGGYLVPHGPPSILIWSGRILFQLGVATMFSCSMVHIQTLAPLPRRTEVIGTLGTSGFIGQIVGTQLADLIFNLFSQGLYRYIAIFFSSGLLALFQLGLVLILTRNETPSHGHPTPSSHSLLWKYWPGTIVLAAIAMGVNLAVTTVFLTRYATVLRLPGIAIFFLSFSITAFTCRWMFRSWPSTLGRHSMVVWGLLGLTAGQLLLILVDTSWKFIGPAALCGFGHALLFPSVVSLGSGKFPSQFRGSGTTLILGFMDAGMITAGPVLGLIIDLGQTYYPGPLGRNGFFGMFLFAASVALVCSITYLLTGAREPDHDRVD